MSTTWPGTPVCSSSIPNEISAPAVTVRASDAQGETESRPPQHRQQQSQRGKQQQAAADPAGGGPGTQRQVHPDAGEWTQIRGIDPGDVQGSQRDPGHQQQMSGEEDDPRRTDAQDGTAARTLTLHDHLDAPRDDIGSADTPRMRPVSPARPSPCAWAGSPPLLPVKPGHRGVFGHRMLVRRWNPLRGWPTRRRRERPAGPVEPDPSSGSGGRNRCLAPRCFR